MAEDLSPGCTVPWLDAVLTSPVSVFEGAAEVRLADGGKPCAGRVEVKQQGQWGTVCGDYWDMNDAAVVCKQLGCGTAVGAPQYGRFGPGSGPIWMDGVGCNGTESALSDCTHMGWGENNCDHAYDAGVMCSEYTGFRLVNGSTACEGRVEVQVLGTWGTLCSTRWDLSDAHVLCRQLNCGFAESIPGGEHSGRETGPVWRDSFHCEGTEAHLGQCPVITLGVSPCSHGNNAAVICSGSAGFASLRLVGGGSRCDGRVEIFQHGTWGRVLDDQWDVQEASVVCRQLRCGEAARAYNPPKPERGTGPVGLRGVQCAGHEANLTLCNTSLPESALAAGVVEDVGVICWGSLRVRLVNGAGRCAGRVEIYYQGSWGTVCDDGWDLSDAAVVCRQLGCGGAVEAVGSAQFGEGSRQIWLDGVNCSGAEAVLWDCPARAWGQHDCRHKEDAGVICSEFVALRLENSDGCSGRLQVFYNGTWGSVCSNLMTLNTVSLACKELGCGDGGSLETRLPYGKVSGTTWLDRVECGERNSSFWQCPSAPWDPQSCEELRDETHITCNDPTQGRQTSSGTVSVPVIICIILGALLCLLLALLAWQMLSARAGRRGSRTAQGPFPEAVYEEIGYSPVLQSQERFGRSGSDSEEALTQLQPHPGDSEEEDGLGSAPDVPVLPGSDPADGYGDAREVYGPGEDAAPGQGEWKMPKGPEEAAGPRDAPGEFAENMALCLLPGTVYLSRRLQGTALEVLPMPTPVLLRRNITFVSPGLDVTVQSETGPFTLETRMLACRIMLLSSAVNNIPKIDCISSQMAVPAAPGFKMAADKDDAAKNSAARVEAEMAAGKHGAEAETVARINSQRA
ncbi:scavenger receptor cysteine-rich domain-containing protein SCART1-like [Pterocles gutturalis]